MSISPDLAQHVLEIVRGLPADAPGPERWNASDPEGRLLHAVSEFLTPETARHLVILQCRRSAKKP